MATMKASEPAMKTESPFLLDLHAVDMLSQSDGFNILRQHLAEHYMDYQ